MDKITKDLFYSSKEGILFWVAGYTADNNTDSVQEMIKSLRVNAYRFADQAGCHFDEVCTLYNSRPPRYQYMRVFYTFVPKNLEGAFNLGDDWTMDKWLTT